MRVWLINHYAVPPSESGGTRHHALARYLIRRGHDVTIIASSFNHATGKQRNCAPGKVSTFELCNGVPFVWLRVPAYRNNVTRLWNMLVFAFELWLGLGTRKLGKPDVVIGSSLTLFAALAAERLARREGVPFILEIRDLWPQTLIDMGMRPHHPAVVMFGFIERYLYRHADRIVTLLPNALEYMVPRGARATNVFWIPNGVDMELMPFPRPPIPHAVFTVLYTGSHGLSDALDSILDAAAILNKKAPDDFRFRFVGDGPAKAALIQRTRAENLGNVVFENPVPKQQVFTLLQDADAFIITRKKTDLYRYGISPNKMHEYLAAGRPTVFAGTSNNNPIAAASAGITVAPEDSEAIAQAIADLAMMSIQDRWNMGLRGRNYIAKHHDFESLAIELEQVLKSTLDSPDKVANLTQDVDEKPTTA